MYCLYRHIREDKNEPFYIGNGNYIKTFKSIKSASVECFGNRIGVNYINKACKGLLNNYKKYIWKYENW